MDKDIKREAVRLISDKKAGADLTYADIARKTGYSRRQVMRLAARVDELGPEGALGHGNAGRRPRTAASDAEIAYLREFKKRFPSITVAQFRDIFIEDVIDNPDRRDDVERYRLVARSASWFAALFRDEGWKSPAAKPRRTDGRRVSHPLREPMPRRGMLVQVDGTPYDWFGNGDARALHLAVDDATTEVLAGCFMRTECTRGYARMAERMVRSRGVPEAVYSDKHSIFYSRKARGSSQFAMMMGDLGIRMVYAESPEAKGRVERYNRTAQLRLPNDIIRFGIGDYERLDEWFGEFYVHYLNRKFAFPPKEPRSEFRELPADYDYPSVFRARFTRIARGGMISYEMRLYWMVGRGGLLYDPGEGVRVDVYIDIWTEEMYVEHNGRRFTCVAAGERTHSHMRAQGVSDPRDLQDLLRKMEHM